MWTSIPAISLHQPWALALFLHQADGSLLKRFETRHWSHRLRQGQHLAIHATKNTRELREMLPRLHGMFRVVIGDTPISCGVLLGVVEVARVWPTTSPLVHRSLEAYPHERLWGNFAAGRYAWDFGRRVLLPEPIPYRGQQGIWRIPAEDTTILQQLQVAWEEGTS